MLLAILVRKKPNTLIRGDRGDSVCSLFPPSLHTSLSAPHLLYPWEKWKTRYYCNYRKNKKQKELPAWRLGDGRRPREALFGGGKKNFYFFFPLDFILFYFSFRLEKEPFCSHAVTVKIRFKSQASPWLFPFFQNFCQLAIYLMKSCDSV